MYISPEFRNRFLGQWTEMWIEEGNRINAQIDQLSGDENSVPAIEDVELLYRLLTFQIAALRNAWEAFKELGKFDPTLSGPWANGIAPAFRDESKN